MATKSPNQLPPKATEALLEGTDLSSPALSLAWKASQITPAQCLTLEEMDFFPNRCAQGHTTGLNPSVSPQPLTSLSFAPL